MCVCIDACICIYIILCIYRTYAYIDIFFDIGTLGKQPSRVRALYPRGGWREATPRIRSRNRRHLRPASSPSFLPPPPLAPRSRRGHMPGASQHTGASQGIHCLHFYFRYNYPDWCSPTCTNPRRSKPLFFIPHWLLDMLWRRNTKKSAVKTKSL